MFESDSQLSIDSKTEIPNQEKKRTDEVQIGVQDGGEIKDKKA